MADWLTHVLFTWALFTIITKYKPEWKKYQPLVLIGAILPDIKNVAMLIKLPILEYLAFPFNSFLVVFLLSALTVLILTKEDMSQGDTAWQHFQLPILLTFASASFHLLIDSLYWSLQGRLVPFFPLTLTKVGINIFSHRSEQLLIPALILAAATLIITKRPVSRQELEEKAKKKQEKEEGEGEEEFEPAFGG